jgi:hypothetical protein
MRVRPRGRATSGAGTSREQGTRIGTLTLHARYPAARSPPAGLEYLSGSGISGGAALFEIGQALFGRGDLPLKLTQLAPLPVHLGP